MSLQDLGNLGEFIAAVGVIFSLMYVGYQLQQGRKLVRIESKEKRLDSWTAWRRLTIQDENLLRIWEKGMSTVNGLNSSEKFVFDGMMLEAWLIVSRQYYRAKELNDDVELRQALGSARSIFQFGSASGEWWLRERQTLASPFREWVDVVLKDFEDEI